MDHPEDHSLFGLGLPGYLKDVILISNIPSTFWSFKDFPVHPV